MDIEKFPLRRRMVTEWGLDIDGVFVPWDVLEELNDSLGMGDPYLINDPAIETTLKKHGLAVQETRGGYHRGENLQPLLDSYTSQDWKEQSDDQMLAMLTDLHLAAGAPASRTISAGVTAAGHKISHTTANNTVKGYKFPSWAVLKDVVVFLGGNPDDYHEIWKKARAERRRNRGK